MLYNNQKNKDKKFRKQSMNWFGLRPGVRGRDGRDEVSLIV